jgi:PleD family two-component response regulator
MEKELMMVHRENPPFALIACSDVSMSRELESVFQRHGYVSAHLRSGETAIELAGLVHHDVVVLDESLEDLAAVDVCRTLRDGTLFDHTIPIVINSSGPFDSSARMAAYSAGAWEYCSHPTDLDIVFLKLETFVRARREVARAESEIFVNAATGLYTSFGLRQLAGKFGARALRGHEAFACVAFSPQLQDREVGATTRFGDTLGGFADVAHVFREQSRQSDIVGHIGESRLAILAPNTDAEGARLLVARLQREMDKSSVKKGMPDNVRLRAGYSAVSDLAASHLNVPELVHRAESALDQIPRRGDAQPILNFDDLPTF